MSYSTYAKPAMGCLLAALLLLLPTTGGLGAEEVVLTETSRAASRVQEVSPSDRFNSDDPRRRMQDYLPNLFFHEPVYFLLGVEPEKSKFQLSFKYRLFNPDKSIATHLPWITGLYLGHTQTSLWDLNATSRPFVDTSYKPELFFLSNNIDLLPDWLSDWTVQTGFRHESNGKDEEVSRSTNYIYLQNNFLFKPIKGYCFGLCPTVWVFHNNDDTTNPNVEDYRGYFEIEAGVVREGGAGLTTTFRHGSAGPTFRVDFSYPLDRLFANNVDFYFYAQYFNGYAETLKDYTHQYDAVRLGIAITR